MRLERYYGVENYASLVEDKISKSSRYDGDYGYGNAWDSGVSFSKALQLAKEGDPSLVSQTSDTVDKLVNEFQMREEPKNRYLNAVAGSRVSVPEYLGGSPLCMKRKMKQEMAVRSINIYVATTCSAGIDAKDMIKRGITILALLEFLQMTQIAVQLFLTAETHGRTDGDLIQVIQVESSPLDLSTASFAIAHPAFARHITYFMAEKLDGFNGSWGASALYPNYIDKLRGVLGMEEADIYVPAPKSWDNLIISHPEKWLEERIAKIKAVL
jgi:hypothetical protein